MKLFWVNDVFVNGQSFGYSVHSRKLRDALRAEGVAMVEDAAQADLAVSVTWPTNFTPVPNLRNVLFTQAELSSHPATTEVWERIRAPGGADLLVTSCRHSAEVLGQYYHGAIEVCPLGIDPLLFPFRQRRKPSFGEPFRFIFVNNLRDRQKGLPILMNAWNMWHLTGRAPHNAELYLKASGIPNGEKTELREYQRVTLDERQLSAAEMLELYHSAHAYLSCSYGEAWGLTLTEAMATGLPCVWTHWSAPLDYADETIGFPITDFGMVPFARKQGDEQIAGWGARAREEAIIGAMEEIVAGYAGALGRGRLASERMHLKYTWAQSADRFAAICHKALTGELPITDRAAEIEIELRKAAVLKRSAQMRSELEIMGDPQALTKSQAWCEEQLRALEAAAAGTPVACRA